MNRGLLGIKRASSYNKSNKLVILLSNTNVEFIWTAVGRKRKEITTLEKEVEDKGISTKIRQK